MAAETLKEYLVSIGWEVNESDYKHAKSVVDDFGSKIAAKLTPNIKAFGTAANVVLDILVSTNKVIAQTISSVADFDLEIEKQARLWWVSEEAARSYQTALDALGETNDDLLTMTDEQYRRLIELNQIGRSLEAPKEVDDFLLTIRDVKFEFAKLKVEIQYGMRWVTYFFAKMNGTDATTIRERLRELNEKIQKNLPIIAEKVAKVLNVFYRLGKAAVRVVKVLYDILVNLFDLFDTKLGKTAGLVTSFFLLLKSGPIGWFIAAITSLLLLIDDYMTWQRGGISYFDWGSFDNQFGDIKDNLLDIKDDILDIISFVDKIFDTLNIKLNILDTIKSVVSLIRSFTSLMADDFDRISGAIDAIESGDIFSAFKNFDFGEWLKNRTGDISELYSNPIVNTILPNTKSAGLVSDLLNKAYSFLFGSGRTSVATLPKGSTNTSTTNNNGTTINMNGMSWTFANAKDAANWFGSYLMRKEYSTPIK